VTRTLEVDTLVAYSYFGFQNTDLEQLLQNESHSSAEVINLGKFRDAVDQEVSACYLGKLKSNNSTYLIYAYIFNNKEYGFAWDTDQEEIICHSNHLSDPPWFEFIKQGQLFRIKVNNNNPYLHYITEKPFAFMNSTVLKLGTCRDAFPVEINHENPYTAK